MKLTIKKTNLVRACIISLALLSTGHVYSADDIDIFTNQEVLNMVDSTDFDITRSALDSTIVELLVKAGAPSILQEDLYCRTNSLNERDILDSPLFLPQRGYLYKWTVGSHIFMNQTTRMNFTKDSTNISSYLGINNPSFLDKVQEAESAIGLGLPISPLDVFPLFHNATIQERKFGLMFHTERQVDAFNFRFMLPFYYIERNFFLTENEREAIENMLGAASQEDAELFAKNHLISDKIGFGDTRLFIDYQYLAHEHIIVRLGAQSTIPTAFAVAKSLLGSEHKKLQCRPEFSFSKLFELAAGPTKADKDAASKYGASILLKSLDSLAANLLDVSLGYNKHVGLGPYLQTKTALCRFINRPWAENFAVKSRMSLEYFFPNNEIRYFVEQNKSAEFATLKLNRDATDIIDQANSDPAYAAAVVSFLEKEFINTLFPFACKTLVMPGFIFHSTTKFYYEIERWGFYFGTDTWIQTREQLRHIHCKSSENGPLSPLSIGRAARPMAYQGDAILSWFYKVHRPTKTWTLALNADQTLVSSGIGKEFTLSLDLEANF